MELLENDEQEIFQQNFKDIYNMDKKEQVTIDMFEFKDLE